MRLNRHSDGRGRPSYFRLLEIAQRSLGELLIAALLLCLPRVVPLSAAEPERDIVYAKIDDLPLKLDLYRPEKQTQPLILWVHGGAWRAGSKKEMPLGELLPAGYAIASVDYRLSPVAKFPAQVHDLKAAIRFLRARQMELKIDSRQIVIAGSSAGGHLAALVGVTNGVAELEGKVGEDLAADSSVQAIVSFYGMSNLTTILSQSTPFGLQMRVPALELLLGGQPDQRPELARLASPVFHIDRHDPPLLLLHGDQDPQAPINQAHELEGRYQGEKLRCQFVVLHGSKHGGPAFFDKERLEIVRRFLETDK